MTTRQVVLQKILVRTNNATGNEQIRLAKKTVISTCPLVLFQLIARNDSQLTEALSNLIALSPVENNEITF